MNNPFHQIHDILGATVFAFCLTIIASVSACHAEQIGKDRFPLKSAHQNIISVDIVGFNYTNRYIDSYSVDGQEGGNIFVSSLTSGGGKSACCAMVFVPVTVPFPVKIRWQAGGCIFTTKSTVSGNVFDNIHSFYKEVEVNVPAAPNREISRLEVHFYPDGSVQAQLTGQVSPPRLLMSKEREDRSPYARCEYGKKPK